MTKICMAQLMFEGVNHPKKEAGKVTYKISRLAQDLEKRKAKIIDQLQPTKKNITH